MSPKLTRYIDPLNDLAFKKLFGTEQNKDLLMAFLNEIFKGRKHIVNLVYNKNEYPGELNEIGGFVFDITCTGDQGEEFIIEVQRGEQQYFKDRAIFYTSRAISEQVPKGDRSKWKYKMNEVYLVAIMDDFSFEDTSNSKYLHNIALCDTETGELFYNKLGYSFIVLCNFVKTASELETDLDHWLYVLKNLCHMEQLPTYLSNPIFEKLFDIAEYNNLTKDEKASYDRFWKHKWDNENIRAFAIEKAEKAAKAEKAKIVAERAAEKEKIAAERAAAKAKIVEERAAEKAKITAERAAEKAARKIAMQAARAKGLEEGRREGLQEARQKVHQKGMQEVARKMKNKGLSNLIIKECTKLSALEIENL